MQEAPGTKIMAYRAWMTLQQFVDLWGKVLNVRAKITTLPIDEILDAAPGDLAPDVREMLAEGMANMTEYGWKLHEPSILTQPNQVS